MYTSAPQMGVGWGYESFQGRLSWQPHPQRLRHDAEAIYGTPCKLYWVIRSHQIHNAQKSIINWVVSTSARKSHLKKKKEKQFGCNFLRLQSAGGWLRVIKYTLKTYRLHKSCVLVFNLFSVAGKKKTQKSSGYHISQCIISEAVSQPPQGQWSYINIDQHLGAFLYISASYTDWKQKDTVF